MPVARLSKTFKEIKHNIENQAKRRITISPDDEVAYVDKQRGISVVLDGEGGTGDLKGDIKKSGLYGGCEEDDSIPYLVFLKQAEYFMRVGLTLTALDRLNISMRLEPGSSGEEIICLVEKTDLVKSLIPDVLCARSKCHLKMGRWKNALADARLVLSR